MTTPAVAVARSAEALPIGRRLARNTRRYLNEGLIETRLGGAAAIVELAHEQRKTVTIRMVTHNMQQAARGSDYIACMYLGNRSGSVRATTSSSSHGASGAVITSPVARADDPGPGGRSWGSREWGIFVMGL